MTVDGRSDMSKYPKARWSAGCTSVGASVWTRQVPEGSGGGYYLYDWIQGADRITLEELAEGTTRTERRAGKRSVYITLGEIPVPDSVRRQDRRGREIGVAWIMYADMRQRFGKIAEWIPYGNDGKPVWFHKDVVGSSGSVAE
jgi:hypothetical protein